VLRRLLPLPLLLILLPACDSAPATAPPPPADPRAELLAEQLTNARNKIAELDKRLTALEEAAAAPVPAAGIDPDVAIELPRIAPAVGGGTEATTTSIAVRDAAIYLDGKEIADADLDAAIKAIADANPDASVILSVDDDVAYADVIGLLDRVKAQGITKFALGVGPDAAESAVTRTTPIRGSGSKRAAGGTSKDLKNPFD
jgi:biopolymer transport protein ExbD